jgi:hypothetical protein
VKGPRRDRTRSRSTTRMVVAVDTSSNGSPPR